MTSPDPYMFGSYREYAEAQFEDEQRAAQEFVEAHRDSVLECGTHGLFEPEVGDKCPLCDETLLSSETWRGVDGQ